MTVDAFIAETLTQAPAAVALWWAFRYELRAVNLRIDALEKQSDSDRADG